MFIVSKDRTTIVNVDQITAMYISTDGYSIRVEVQNGKPWNIGRYDSQEETREAIQMITNKLRLSKDTIALMPDADQIKAVLALKDQRCHHITGKKTKGHGGS